MAKIIEWLTGTGGVLRTRALLALMGMGTLSALVIDERLDVDVFVGIVAPLLGFYAGSRVAQDNGSKS